MAQCFKMWPKSILCYNHNGAWAYLKIQSLSVVLKVLNLSFLGWYPGISILVSISTKARPVGLLDKQNKMMVLNLAYTLESLGGKRGFTIPMSRLHANSYTGISGYAPQSSAVVKASP